MIINSMMNVEEFNFLNFKDPPLEAHFVQPPFSTESPSSKVYSESERGTKEDVCIYFYSLFVCQGFSHVNA